MSSPHYKFVVLLFSRQINRPIFENVAEEDLLRERSECTERPWAPSADSPTQTLLRSWPLTSPKSNCRPTTLASTSLLNSFTSFLPHPPNNSFRRSLFFYVCFICFPGNSRKERRKLGILPIYFDSSLLKHENFNNYLSFCFLKNWSSIRDFVILMLMRHSYQSFVGYMLFNGWIGVWFC